MSRKRAHIPDRVKLAAAIIQLLQIPHEHAKLMTVDQVLSLIQWDHYPIPHAAPYNGPDEHWNLTGRSIGEHRAKTAKVDVPAMGKGRRIADDQAAFRARMLLPSSDRKADKKSKWPKGRKLQSRNTFKKKG